MLFPGGEPNAMGQTAELNNAVEYIESHLDGEIDIAQAARLAVCSGFHFQRGSSYMAGVTLSGYIRRRRMTLAAFELAEAGASIIDMAQKYGYESPTAFNRAFQSVHGVAPSAARQQGIPLPHIPRAGLPSFNPWRSGTELQNLEKKMPSASSVFA